MKLHASGEDYLETILVLQKKLGMVRSVDVARHMEVSKPSVCHAVATLRDGGFLTMDEDHFLHLTDVGREVAEKIYERHCFFTKQLIAAGVNPKTAENLSMLENEKVCTLLYIASRRFAAKPAEALAANLPARAPKTRLTMDMTTISRPYRSTTGRLLASRPSSIIMAVIKGSRISMMTSRAVSPMVRKVSFL